MREFPVKKIIIFILCVLAYCFLAYFLSPLEVKALSYNVYTDGDFGMHGTGIKGSKYSFYPNYAFPGKGNGIFIFNLYNYQNNNVLDIPIKNVTVTSDTGNYTCLATNSDVFHESHSDISLEINYTVISYQCPMSSTARGINSINITFGGVNTGAELHIPTVSYIEFYEDNSGENKLDDINTSINDQKDQQHQDSQDTQNKIDEVGDKVGDMNDTIKDSNTDEAQNSANGFFNGFEDNDHGLSGIVSAPLTLITKFNSPTCTPVKLNFKGNEVELPCGSYLYDRPGMQPVMVVYNTIVGGLLAYGAVCGIRKKVDDFKNPDDSKVEVLDL